MKRKMDEVLRAVPGCPILGHHENKNMGIGAKSFIITFPFCFISLDGPAYSDMSDLFQADNRLCQSASARFRGRGIKKKRRPAGDRQGSDR
jgi:hypothetical protein